MEVASNRVGYVGPFMHPASGSSTENSVQVPLPTGGTVSNVRFYVGVAPGSGNWVFEVMKNGNVPTGLACEIFGSNTDCSATGSAVFAPGDRISVNFIALENVPARVSWVATLQ